MLALVALFAAIALQPAPRTAAEAAATVRVLYLAHDYEEGERLATQYIHRFPTPELRAWRILHLTRLPLLLEAERAADSLASAYPTSTWSTFARAFVLAQRGENAGRAQAIASRVYAAAPRD